MRNIMVDINNLPFEEELKILEEYGIDAYKFIELLGGDIFVSVWDNPDNNTDPNILASVSITDASSVEIILDALSEDSADDIYTIGGYLCYIKDSILYISSNYDIIDSIINGELPASSISSDKLDLAKNNTMSLYLEFDPNLSLYGVGDDYTEAFESIYFTSNILESNHTQMILKINTRDKERNSLYIIKSFFGLE